MFENKQIRVQLCCYTLRESLLYQAGLLCAAVYLALMGNKNISFQLLQCLLGQAGSCFSLNPRILLERSVKKYTQCQKYQPLLCEHKP